ncbi:MAG: DeoR/GlpR family DNA-binding transcription regulator [Hyphomicrobiaceae bacterium]|nr:DeoR/GlpR family DNA-binding transcription regulator [Hyphomicrobiaceae bacterium]
MADALQLETASNPGLQSRQTEILELVRRQGFVSIDQLAKAFRVSEQTVRRDIKQLERRGLVARYHGGAGLPRALSVMDYGGRQSRYPVEKRVIGELLAAQIPEGSTIFIDIGTTMEAVAEALSNHQNLTIVTNHLTVASMLSRRGSFQVILAGGLLRHNDHATTGEATREFLERFRVGYGIFGIGSIDTEGELLDYDYRDIGVSKAAMHISRRKFVALDHSKFGSDAAIRVGHASEIDAVFTDQAPPEPFAGMLAREGVSLHVPE